MENKRVRRILIIVFIIVFGMLLRFFFASHAYPLLVFDAKAYVDHAQEFLRGSFPVDLRHKNMGYSLFLAIIFWFRGGNDIAFVKFIQIFLDLSAGIFIWIAARKVFSQKTSDVALFLYMINPFTSSYVGILLPEVLSCFFVGLLLTVTTRKGFRSNILIWFLVGLLLGLLLFVKPSLLFFAIGVIGMISFLCFKKGVILKFLIVSLVGFLLASSYTLIINYKSFGQVLFTPPYSTIGGQTYLMMFYADRYPEVEFWGITPQLRRMYEEYESTPNSQISDWNKRYISLIFPKLASEPVNFLSHYVKNLFWLWDKDHLSVYQDSWYPADRYILRVINLVFLGLCIVGIVRYLGRGLKALHEPFVVVTLILLAVMSLWFPLVSNESRHTIPFYPLLYFWAAYGIGTLMKL